jgi:hypothetical protein
MSRLAGTNPPPIALHHRQARWRFRPSGQGVVGPGIRVATRGRSPAHVVHCTTRSIVLGETPESPTLFITIAARLNERVSALAVAIRSINKGVNSRASRRKSSREAEKAPPTAGAVT